MNFYTVCPGSSDPPEKKHLMYLHQKMGFTPFIMTNTMLYVEEFELRRDGGGHGTRALTRL